MLDRDCIDFLQWALPRMRMRWPGFRKVRGQVCKRIDRRMREVEARDIAAYRAYLDEHAEEWAILDSLCRVTISRFFRDHSVFDFLADAVLPNLAGIAQAQGDKALRCWSIGCASGEEPYTLALLWDLRLRQRYPPIDLKIIATDADAQMIERAKAGHYPASSLRDMPGSLIKRGFIQEGRGYRIQDSVKGYVEFLGQDIRRNTPEGPFHLVLCRNVVFTYFDEDLQREIAERLFRKMLPGGALVVGRHERLPEQGTGFLPWPGNPGIYRRS